MTDQLNNRTHLDEEWTNFMSRQLRNMSRQPSGADINSALANLELVGRSELSPKQQQRLFKAQRYIMQEKAGGSQVEWLGSNEVELDGYFVVVVKWFDGNSQQISYVKVMDVAFGGTSDFNES